MGAQNASQQELQSNNLKMRWNLNNSSLVNILLVKLHGFNGTICFLEQNAFVLKIDSNSFASSNECKWIMIDNGLTL